MLPLMVTSTTVDDGVLGGYGKLTPMDSRDSNRFLDRLIEIRPSLELGRAADCGAGIGRVAKHFLLPRFQHVDLVEQSPRLLQASAEYIGEDSSRTTCVELGLQVRRRRVEATKCYQLLWQDFAPPPNSYDVIWIQWVIGHLHDIDFISFFKRCCMGLREG
jgi:protein N-terminal methyltransferase